MTRPADQPAGPPGRPTAGGDPQVAIDQVASRVQMVIDAAERAAEAIRLDAEQQAADYLSEARRRADELTARRVSQIADLTDELVDHADAVRLHSKRMAASLEQAIRSVEQENEAGAGEATPVRPDDAGTGDPTQDPAEPEQPIAAPSQRSRPIEAPSEPSRPIEALPADRAQRSGPTEVPADTLLYATRLAIAGSDRGAVSRALRSELGIADPEPVLSRIFDR